MNNKVYFLDFKGKGVVNIFKGFIPKEIDLKKSNREEIINVKYNINEFIEVPVKNIYYKKADAEKRINEYQITRYIKSVEERKCKYCGKLIVDRDDLTIDHIIPLSRGGTWDRENIIISCKKCNTHKASIHIITHINIDIKAQILREKKGKSIDSRRRKVAYGMKLKTDNIEEIAKRDSNIWNINAFFSKKSEELLSLITNK